MSQNETEIIREIRSEYEYGFHVPEDYFFKSGRGLSHELVEAIAEHKSEPEWMRKFRHKSLDYFLARPLPTWGGDLTQIDFDDIFYYIKPTEKQADSWEDLPADIKDTWDRLGIPEAEKKYLAGVGAQYESEVVYHKLQADLEAKGVLFLDMDSGLDIDALKIVARGVNDLVGPEMGALLITHYQRILNYVKPDFVHVFVDGRIVEEGGPELAHRLEAEGYEAFTPAAEAV